MATYFDEKANVILVPYDEYEAQAQQLRLQGDAAVEKYGRAVADLEQKVGHLVRNEKRNAAMTFLSLWALATGKAKYHQKLSPQKQRALLQRFSAAAVASIKRTELRKQRYEDITSAYKICRPIILRFRKEQALKNWQTIPSGPSRKLWNSIRKTGQWKKLVEETTQKKLGITRVENSTPTKRAHTDMRLRVGVNFRWSDEFPRPGAK